MSIINMMNKSVIVALDSVDDWPFVHVVKQLLISEFCSFVLLPFTPE